MVLYDSLTLLFHIGIEIDYRFCSAIKTFQRLVTNTILS